MEKFRMPEAAPVQEGGQEQRERIAERVTEHSRAFDRETAAAPAYAPEEIRQAWRREQWNVGGANVEAIGLHHAPETFLEYRREIERAIRESDIVVNEFAPEALGFYDAEQGRALAKQRSRFNPDYSVEDLRQAYLQHERVWGLGAFHHEIELLAAKYGKDMASADLTLTKNPEQMLQDAYLYQYGAEQIADRKKELPRLGLYGGAIASALIGLGKLIENVRKPVSRRDFLKAMGFLGAGAALGAAGKMTTEVSRTPSEKISEEQKKSETPQLEGLRDPHLAESLQELSEVGYKKIAFIYGTRHLDRVKRNLDNPAEAKRTLAENQDLINRNNPDAFRVWRLSPGRNNSERFTASSDMIWQRIH